MSTEAADRHSHTKPRSTRLHLFRQGSDAFILDVEDGRILGLPDGQGKAVEAALRLEEPARAEMIALGLGTATAMPGIDQPPKSVPLKALSLAVAQKCNLGCTYCYAQQGTFGGDAGEMPVAVARASVDRLLEGARSGEKIVLAFMGGEPLASRKTLHAATHYAAERAAARGIGLGFTMTTNATLVRAEDIDLFQRYGFTLTISIDGLQADNDRLRPFASGRGSFEKVATNVAALLAVDRRRYRVFARVTVTPRNLDLANTMTGLLDMGFDSVMFSPMLSAPTGNDEMQRDDLDTLLDQLIQCGEIFRKRSKSGQILPFANVITTLQRIHAYKRDQYPCGAGGGYMGVSASGDLYACHRFVNDEHGRMGDVRSGVDPEKQSLWLDSRHLQKQLPCRSCWARYLCSGSCHYEVIKRGRPACDYIRGWLDYCLALYTGLLRDQPELLGRILRNG